MFITPSSRTFTKTTTEPSTPSLDLRTVIAQRPQRKLAPQEIARLHLEDFTVQDDNGRLQRAVLIQDGEIYLRLSTSRSAHGEQWVDSTYFDLGEAIVDDTVAAVDQARRLRILDPLPAIIAALSKDAFICAVFPGDVIAALAEEVRSPSADIRQVVLTKLPSA